MRVLLVIGNRLIRQVVEQHLKAYGLIGTAVPLSDVLAADDCPAVLLWAKCWHEQAAVVVRRLDDLQAVPFVVCADSIQPTTYLAILQSGARAVSPEDRDLLEALVFQVARTVRHHGESHFQLGRQMFDPVGGCLFDEGERITLSPVEVRLLRRLCMASAAHPARRVTTHQLTGELRSEGAASASRKASVRNYIAKLRRLLAEDPERPTVLLRDAGGYYVVLAVCRRESASSRRGC